MAGKQETKHKVECCGGSTADLSPLVSARHPKMKHALDDVASQILTTRHGISITRGGTASSQQPQGRPYTILTRLLESDAPELGGTAYTLTRHEDAAHGHWVHALPRSASSSSAHGRHDITPPPPLSSSKAKAKTKAKAKAKTKDSSINDIVTGIASLGLRPTTAAAAAAARDGAVGMQRTVTATSTTTTHSDGVNSDGFVELVSSLSSLNLTTPRNRPSSSSRTPSRLQDILPRLAALGIHDPDSKNPLSKLAILHAILRVLDVHEDDLPNTITACRRLLHTIHVNIQDVIPALEIELGPFPELRRPPEGYGIKRYTIWGLRKELRSNRRCRFVLREAKDLDLNDLLRSL
ncbi:hypothetical protein OC835_001901 [Tilletia horrida]|uniref:Uncharacterized protein n=1 Tax=Tilletia horrida TaxID=155126 RepID=A0AAN6G8H4_9BASI|nr:hypothetical protein OC842_005052 [Tilletia horrida]KAK0536856.1 hypothetical protein OC835_001901 [Tilletia horrida]